MGRVFREDAYVLGMLQVFSVSNGTQRIVLLDDLKKYYETIEKNLDDMGSNVTCKRALLSKIDEKKIYFATNDKEGRACYILNPDFEMDYVTLIRSGLIPFDVLLAATKSNSLDCLGIVSVDEKLVTKWSLKYNEEKSVKKLTKIRK